MSDSSVVLIFFTVLMLVGMSLILNQSRQRLRRNKQFLGLTWLKLMAQLIAQIQQHRGLTNGYLNGGVQLENDIKPLVSHINRTVLDIRNVDGWVVGNDRWISFNDHWQRLSATYKEKSADGNLREHNAIIQGLLFLVDDTAQAHDLLLLGDKNVPLQLLWRDVLTTAEFIGQARAIGTGLAAQGVCDSVARIRLNYLCQKILTLTDIIWKELSLDGSKKHTVNELVNCIQENIVKDKITMSPQEYFDIASRAINSLHEQYGKKVDQHLQLIQSR